MPGGQTSLWTTLLPPPSHELRHFAQQSHVDVLRMRREPTAIRWCWSATYTRELRLYVGVGTLAGESSGATALQSMSAVPSAQQQVSRERRPRCCHRSASQQRSAQEPTATVFSGPPSHLASPESFAKSSTFRPRERSISAASVSFIAVAVLISSMVNRTKSVVPLRGGPSFFV